MFFSCYTYIYF